MVLAKEKMGKYYKNIDGYYITGIGLGIGDVEITQEEYASILYVARNGTSSEPGFIRKLRIDLTWELVKEPVKNVDDEADY